MPRHVESPAVSISLRFAPELLSRIDAEASVAGLSRSAWIADAVERRLSGALGFAASGTNGPADVTLSGVREPAAIIAPAPGSRRSAAPESPAALAPEKSEKCRHPLSRRIGKLCAQCGSGV
jgi:hypothetical protein